MQLSHAIPFLEKLLSEIDAAGIETEGYVCDHICYRVADLPTYESEKTEMSRLGTLLVESEVGGRPIATYRLHSPIVYRDLKIAVLELPAPKEGRPFRTGFEHIEYATGFHPEKLIKMYPQITFKTTGLKKILNAEIEVKLASGSVKFHELPLETVIQIEIGLADA